MSKRDRRDIEDQQAFDQWLRENSAFSSDRHYLHEPLIGSPTFGGGKVKEVFHKRDSETDPLVVNFLPGAVTGTEFGFGVHMHPGRRDRGSKYDWDRDLGTDLDALWTQGVRTIVCAVEPNEFSMLGVHDYVTRCENYGFEVLFFPIRDVSVPVSMRLMHKLCIEIWNRLHDGNVFIHCRGGKGRSGTIATCLLETLGYSYKDALMLVRSVRERAVETRTQEEWCEDYGKYIGDNSRRTEKQVGAHNRSRASVPRSG